MGAHQMFLDNLLEQYREMHGYADEILEGKVKLLKTHVSTLTVNKKGYEDELAFIEFSVWMHVIFIAPLLNKNARLVITEECRMRDSLMEKL